jgi:acyl carrier protein
LAIIGEVRQVLAEVLQLGTRAEQWRADTALLGSLPELDSLVVISLIGALERHFGISVENDEINAATFATLGTLSAFVDEKVHSPNHTGFSTSNRDKLGH